MINICHQMKEHIGLILYNTVNYYLNKVINKTLIKGKHRHEKKLANLHQHKRKPYGESNALFIRNIVHNYSHPNYFKPQQSKHGIRIFLPKYHKLYFAIVRGCCY